jgi:sec-independent protein translocase protein TatC
MDSTRVDVQTFVEKYQPYFVELRSHLIVTMVLFAVGCILGLFFSQSILQTLLGFFHFNGVNIVTTSPYQFIDMTFTVSSILGILLATPYALFRLYFFVEPALLPREKKFVLSFLPLSAVLFVFGFGFGLQLMQMMINFYSAFNSGFAVNGFWDVQHFLAQILFTSFFMGLVFQIPIVISGLIRLRIVSRKHLERKRPIVYAVSVIIAILLPTKDLFSLVLETFPLFFLFEFGLLLNR